MFVIISIT